MAASTQNFLASALTAGRNEETGLVSFQGALSSLHGKGGVNVQNDQEGQAKDRSESH
jgi:hypothetical protein